MVVGLGNPGPKYAGTRHNVGFDVIDYLAASPSASSFRARFQGDVAELRENDQQILLLKPYTYMNLSGRSVREAIDFHKLPVEQLLVICDDINLPLAKLRVRGKGSHGGQNGLRNIQDMLGTDSYARLRIGVGQPTFDAADYVLSRFKPNERQNIDEAIARAAQGVITWATQGLEACMTQVNGPGEVKPKAKKKPTEPRSDGQQPTNPASGPDR